MNERANPGDDQYHQGRQRIQPQRKRDLERARSHPGEHHFIDRANATHRFEVEHRIDRVHRHRKRGGHRAGGQAPRHGLRPAATNRRVDQEAEKRQERNQQ